MSKRKLSKKQAWRARKIQEDRIRRAKKKQSAISPDAPATGTEQEGRIIASFGTQFLVEDPGARQIPCLARQNLGGIVVGDEVVWQPTDEGNGVIIAVKPRKSVLERPNYHGNTKLVAANIDQIVIVCSPVPALQTPLIDRYLVAVEINTIPPLLAVNKIDLLDKTRLAALHETMEQYEAIGYPVLYYSTKSLKGISQLASQLRNKLSILVGQSGVGKSSTVKALLPDIDIQIGEISQASRLGKHTTSASRLYHLPDGGEIIDSPGVRDFGLWHLPREKISWGFVEFRPYLGQCKFSNCTHRNEPGCAIIDAVGHHRISRMRWRNYVEIYDKLEKN